MQQDTTAVYQLLDFATEAERYLTGNTTPVQSEVIQPARDACAVARGYVDLVRLYGEPVNIDNLERVLVAVADAISDRRVQRRYLTRLRSIVAWSRLSSA